jgi:capsular polysaccharide biosynthesis protein
MRGGGRVFRNTREVDELFRSRGFEVIFPEQLDVTTQIRIVRDAKVLAGAGGSALHLAAFATDGKVVEIGDTRTRTTFVATQCAIAAVLDQPIAHIPYLAKDDSVFDLEHLASQLLELGC